MGLSELRDEILTKRAKQQALEENNAKALKELESILASDYSEISEKLESVGIYVQPILTVDTKRLLDDSEYLKWYQNTVNETVGQIEEFLRGQLV